MAATGTPVVIQWGLLIDGNGGKPVDHATVIIEGNRIERYTTFHMHKTEETSNVQAQP